jgi:hypothetical protein
MAANRNKWIELRISSKLQKLYDRSDFSYIQQYEMEKGFTKQIEWNGMEGKGMIHEKLNVHPPQD